MEFTCTNMMHRLRTRVPQPKSHSIKFTLPYRSVSRVFFLFVQRLSQYWPYLPTGHRYVYRHWNFTVYSKQNQVMYYHCHFTLTVHWTLIMTTPALYVLKRETLDYYYWKYILDPTCFYPPTRPTSCLLGNDLFFIDVTNKLSLNL